MIEGFMASLWSIVLGFVVTSVLGAIAYAFRRQIGRMIGKLTARREEALIGRLEDRLLDRLDEELAQRLDVRIQQRLEEMRPPPPPHGITGTLCQKTGLYRTQGDFLEERTFREGEEFPTAMSYDRARDVVWVYQYPE